METRNLTWLVEIGTADGFERGSTHPGEVKLTTEAGSEIRFTGLGEFLEIGQITNDTALSSLQYRLTFRIPPGEALNAPDKYYGGYTVRLWLAAINAEGEVQTLLPMVNGAIDTVDLALGDSKSLTVTARDRALTNLYRTSRWKYTHAHQQELYDGDQSLRDIATIQTAKLTWGGLGL